MIGSVANRAIKSFLLGDDASQLRTGRAEGGGGGGGRTVLIELLFFSRFSTFFFQENQEKQKKQEIVPNFGNYFTPRTAHELAHLSCIAQAWKTCADELSPIAQAGENMCSSCSAVSYTHLTLPTILLV